MANKSTEKQWTVRIGALQTVVSILARFSSRPSATQRQHSLENGLPITFNECSGDFASIQMHTQEKRVYRWLYCQPARIPDVHCGLRGKPI